MDCDARRFGPWLGGGGLQLGEQRGGQERDGADTAVRRAGVHGDGEAVAPGEHPDDGEAELGRVVEAGDVHLSVACEQPGGALHGVGVHADAGVVDDHARAVVHGLDVDLDGGVGLGVPGRVVEELGGKVVQKTFPPLTVPDYGTYLAQLNRKADAIYLGFAGSNGFRYLRQFNEYGLRGKIAAVGGMTALDEAVLRNMGDEALGVLTACWYSAELDNPQNKKFAPAFRAEAKYDPGFYAAATYTEAQGAAVMAREEITIRIELGRGACSETIWTTDLSHEYVKINAEYRT